MYAITGATGKVGGAVARHLLAQHQPTRVIIRDAAKAAAWEARGATIALADNSAIVPLAEALAGADGAFIMLPSNFDPSPGFPEAREVIATLRDAVARAQPAKVVALSTIGANATQPNLLNQLGLLEQAFADLPMPVTFLRAAWFMENASWNVAEAQRDGIYSSHLQPAHKRFPMIATDDVGRTAAELLQEDWRGVRVVEVEGPVRVSPDEIAAAFGTALGRNVRTRVLPRDTWEAQFRASGMQRPLPRIQMIDGFNEGWIDFADRGAHARRGSIGIDAVIAKLVAAS
jgi:uncharacterized protein YbjT (DUF2867 family)